MHYDAAKAASVVVAALSVAGVLQPAAAYRIFAYEPSYGHSHWNVMSAVLESLVDAGHEVVCVTVQPATEHLAGHPNYTHVDMSGVVGNPHDIARDLEYAQLMRMFRSNAYIVRLVTSGVRTMCKLLADMPEVRDMLDGGRRFDAVVMESLHSECQSMLPARLDVPVVYMVPCAAVTWMPTDTGSPDHPSYLGTLLTGHPTPVTFVQRLANVLVLMHTNLVRWYHDAAVDPSAVQWPRPRDAMVFVNTHHSVEPVRPLGPNVLEIGGIHLRPPKPIPQDLIEVLDKSNEFGVIVLSFGSVMAMESLPKNILNSLKFAFKQLPQTVIWKYENDHMPDKPENVVLCKWLPQRAILQHPNVKLFVSNGGMSGMYEAVDAGVPVLGVPMFFDQPRNVQNLVHLGMALSLTVENITGKSISGAIDRLLNDRSFSENAARVSSLFRDRPVSPSDSAVYWVEYLIRHGGTADLRPLSADASWTSHFMVDMFVALTAAVLTVWFCARIVVHKVIGKLFPSSKSRR